ncbi:MAG TPA: hypothetical protein VIG99_19140 [Myxococcaceae bacterium]
MRRAAAVAWVVACAAWADEVQPKDAGGALARQLQFQVKKVVSLEAHTTQPSFYSDPRPHLVDRDRALYYGRGAFHGPGLVYLLDVKTLEERILEAPTAAFVAQNPKLVIHPVVEDLLCYDRADGWAALLLNDTAPQHKKVYLAWWNLAENRISTALLLGEQGPKDHWVAAHSIGYLPERGECVVQVARSSGGKYDHSVVAVGREAVRTIATFEGNFIASHGPYFDAAHQRAMVTEISEDGSPNGYLVDLASGGVRTFPIPQLVYGFTFDPDGRTLYAYGVKARELWAINAATGAAVRRVRIGDIGHALGWIGDSLVVVGNVRIHLLDRQTFGHRAQVGTRRIAPKSVNVESSVVLPGAIIALNDFYRLHLTHLER